MSPYEHLAVLISIVLGLGLTQLLATLHRLVAARRRVTPYWLPLTWTVLLFVSLIEWWWASFSLRQQTVWNFFYFLFVLLSPISLYLAATFVLPEISPNDDTHHDLRQYYYDSNGWFFGVLAMSPALDAIRRGVQAGSWSDFGAVSNAISAVLLIWLANSKRPSHHAVVTAVTGGLFLYFIVSSALQLR